MKLSKKLKIFIAVCLLLLPVLSAYAQTPRRIVSLAPSITESLYQLGAQDCLIGVTSYCNHPPQAKTKNIIGNLSNPNIEKIYSLSPDLVLTVEGTNRPRTIKKLKDLNLKVVTFKQATSLDDITKNFIRLGKLLEKQKEAQEIVEEVESKVSFIAQKVEGLPSLRIFWQVGAHPLVTAGRNSFVSDFMKYAGGINIFANIPIKYPRVSREEVIKRNPEIIILVTMGDVTAKEEDYWRQFKDLEAVKINRIYIVNADKVCRPTPRSFLAGLNELAKLLHPEAFKEREQI